jgi:hypothetical protein
MAVRLVLWLWVLSGLSATSSAQLFLVVQCSTDSLTCFNNTSLATLDNDLPANSVLVVQPGIYRFNTTVTFTANNLTITGTADPTSTVLVADSTLNFQGEGTKIRNVTVWGGIEVLNSTSLSNVRVNNSVSRAANGIKVVGSQLQMESVEVFSDSTGIYSESSSISFNGSLQVTALGKNASGILLGNTTFTARGSLSIEAGSKGLQVWGSQFESLGSVNISSSGSYAVAVSNGSSVKFSGERPTIKNSNTMFLVQNGTLKLSYALSNLTLNCISGGEIFSLPYSQKVSGDQCTIHRLPVVQLGDYNGPIPILANSQQQAVVLVSLDNKSKSVAVSMTSNNSTGQYSRNCTLNQENNFQCPLFLNPGENITLQTAANYLAGFATWAVATFDGSISGAPVAKLSSKLADAIPIGLQINASAPDLTIFHTDKNDYILANLSIGNIQEVDSNNNVVSTGVIQNSGNWTVGSGLENSSAVFQTFEFQSSLFAGSAAQVLISFSLFKEASTLTYAEPNTQPTNSYTFPVDPTLTKMSLTVNSWPWTSIKNRLRVEIGISPTFSYADYKPNTPQPNMTTLIPSGLPLSVRLVDFALVQTFSGGSWTQVPVFFTTNNSKLVLEFPYAGAALYYDPDFAELTDGGQSSSNTGLIVGVSVAVPLAVIAVVLIISTVAAIAWWHKRSGMKPGKEINFGADDRI